MAAPPFEFPDFKPEPIPPSPVTGIDRNLDKMMMLTLGGNQASAAVYAHAFNVQRELLAYAFHIYEGIDDPLQKQYVEALIRQLAIATNQAVMSVANASVQQIQALIEGRLNAPAAPAKLSIWRQIWDYGSLSPEEEPRREGESVMHYIMRNL